MEAVLLDWGFLSRIPNDTQRIYPIPNRLNGRHLRDRRRIYCLVHMCWKKQRTRPSARRVVARG
jgi:hypothetical protein